MQWFYIHDSISCLSCLYHETLSNVLKNPVHCWQIYQPTSSTIATQQFIFNICMHCMFTQIISKDLIALKDFQKRCTQSRDSSQQTPKTTLLLLHVKYGTKMNYTQHLLIWHAKYTALMPEYRSGTPVLRCDKAVVPHLCAPTESFYPNVLLMHLILHVTQCLTSHCRTHRQGVS